MSTLRSLKQNAALVRASVAFLQAWERQGGTDVVAARTALLAVFQITSPAVLRQAFDIWQQDRCRAA